MSVTNYIKTDTLVKLGDLEAHRIVESEQTFEDVEKIEQVEIPDTSVETMVCALKAMIDED